MEDQINQLHQLVTSMKRDQTAILTRLDSLDNEIQSVKVSTREKSPVVDPASSLPASHVATPLQQAAAPHPRPDASSAPRLIALVGLLERRH